MSAIELVVYRRDAQAVIIIRDDGPHIAVADAGQTPQERHYSRELAARIIATHGGTLAVAENRTCANAVCVRLPSTRQSLRNSPVPSWISDAR
ncbi:ATP-binding protein [Mycolicibacterium phocaicum]|uniref:ATP-binding protein n=1 Tax=Mycolicibacterium phocaicum TaxID=319706 RepID=UPI001CFA7FF2|nr:ATP-binding protein [Mycolicibacterium phocaicum]UCZ59928.1 ATP-binding protein [Mycolicibacterium phocaicum]